MWEFLLLPFFQRALLTGSILSIILAVLGVFIVTKRLSFFVDTIGHSALTGIALGLLLHLNPFISALVFALLIAFGLTFVRHSSRLALDTILGVFFASSVALGVILLQLSPGYQTNLVNFLFGDILTVSGLDVVSSLLLLIITFIIMFLAGKKIISIIFNEDIATTEGINVPAHELLLLLLLATSIALAIKLVGIILVTALVVIPAASAQSLARSLTGFFIWSIGIGLSTTVIGMIVSALFSLPAGPAIVLVGTIWFILSLLLKRR